MINKSKQHLFYFLGFSIGLLSRVKKFILNLNAPAPRPFSNSDYIKNLDYDSEILKTMLAFSGQGDFFRDKYILEIGPGPDLMLGLMLLDGGAKYYQAIDFFPVLSSPPYFYANLRARLSSLPAQLATDQVIKAIKNKTPLETRQIGYKIISITDQSLVATEKNKYDLIFSKDVLEHVSDLGAAFKNMRQLLRPGGRLIHKVDFGTHTSFIQDVDRLNFLRYSDSVYERFVKFNGGPNRLRLNKLIEIASKNGLEVEKIQIDKQMSPEELAACKDYLSKNYRNLPDKELIPLSAWIMFK